MDYLQLAHLNCEFQTDCKVAVAELQLQDHLQLVFGNLIEDIQQLYMQMHHVSITFAPRTTNKVAHRLASFAFDSTNQVEWVDSVPFFLRDVLYLDYIHSH